MPARSFQFQWAQRTWASRVEAYTGKSVPYSASTQFAGARLTPGDQLYVLALDDGRENLLLIGRFEVAARSELLPGESRKDALLTHEEALSVLGPSVYGVPLYGTPKDKYVLPRHGTATPMRFDRIVPSPEKLRFESPAGPRYLAIDREGLIDRQAIRSVSRLSHISTRRLDELLD